MICYLKVHGFYGNGFVWKWSHLLRAVQVSLQPLNERFWFQEHAQGLDGVTSLPQLIRSVSSYHTSLVDISAASTGDIVPRPPLPPPPLPPPPLPLVPGTPELTAMPPPTCVPGPPPGLSPMRPSQLRSGPYTVMNPSALRPTEPARCV